MDVLSQDTDRVSLRHVRRNCLDCTGGSRPAILWCSCDGLHSTQCEFWPFRFGATVAAHKREYGPRLVTPGLMPPAGLDLDLLPGTLEAAATAAIDLPGYSQPAVEVAPPPPRMSQEQRDAAAARMRSINAQRARQPLEHDEFIVQNLADRPCGVLSPPDA